MWDICEKTDRESQQTPGWGHTRYILLPIFSGTKFIAKLLILLESCLLLYFA